MERFNASLMTGLAALAVIVGHTHAVAVLYLQLGTPAEIHDNPPATIGILEYGRQAAFLLTALTAGVIAGRSGRQRLGGVFFCLGLMVWTTHLAYAFLAGPLGLPTKFVIMTGEAVFTLVPLWASLLVGGALVALGLWGFKQGHGKHGGGH